MKSSVEKWDPYRGKIYSRNGGWVVGKGVYCHGYNLLEDLVGKVSYFQTLVLNATGRLPSRALAEWIEAAHICLSWPDPRIWCNQIGALAGTVRASAVAATAMGNIAADSRTYGIKPLLEGVGFIQKALAAKKNGMSAESIVAAECAKHRGKPNITGYARPLAKGDERIEKMEKVSEKLGFFDGEHLALAYEIEAILMRDFDEGMNINGYCSAFLADQAYRPDEIYHFCSILVSSGVLGCYIDTSQRPANTFLPMRCDDIDYQGKPPRPVPDK
jgi:citrate synthase